MRDVIEEVIELQRDYSHQNTDKMKRRGQLIRDKLPEELKRLGNPLRSALGRFGEDATAEGRDGTINRTRIPWVRWYSSSRSPSAQSGWYIVYLFHPEGAGVSLCLSHGSTSLQNGSYVSRSDEEAAELMTWAASVVGAEFKDDRAVRRGIELGTHELARAYEKTTVFSKLYAAGNIPSDADLLQDIIRFCEPLRKLYRAKDLRLEPGETHVDVAALNQEIEKFTAPLRTRTGGQGRGLPAPLRKLVEMHAMGRAKDWLKVQGFTYKDVSASDSCDFRASRSDEEWIVEVKGTTGGPGSILVTRNEVALHRQAYPRNMLLVVHGIELDVTALKVAGGDLLAMVPWLVDEERLSPVCFEYRLG